MARLGAGKIFLGIAGIALTFTACAFAGVALFLLLQRSLETATAAAITALCFILLPASWAAWKVLNPPPPPPQATAPETAALSALAGLAQKNPLVAVVGAALLGAGQYWLRRRR